MKMKWKLNKKSAFTLAEVLITLGIIGVIAALTIPTLVQNANERATVSQLKKIYSVLISATDSIIAEEGPISSWNWDEAGSRIDAVVDSYKKQLQFSKTCGFNVNFSCYYENNWKMLNGNPYFTSFTGGNAYYNILQDGTYIKFEKSGGCTWAYCTNVTPKLVIYVNLNGDKPPNQTGRDVFVFLLTAEKGLITPNPDSLNDTCNTAARGVSCSTKVLQEDAINY